LAGEDTFTADAADGADVADAADASERLGAQAA
jgi:hypothetical protein